MKMTGNPLILFFTFCWVLILVSTIRIESFYFSDVGFVFVLIIFQSFLLVSLSKGLLNQTYWVFSLLFFGVVPILEIEFGVRSYVGMPPLTDLDITYAGVCIFTLNFVYAITYEVFKKRKKIETSPEFLLLPINNGKMIMKPYNETSFFVISFLIGLLSFFIVFNDLENNFIALFFRGGDFQETKVEWGPQKLIVQRFVRPLPMILFLSFVVTYGYKAKIKIVLLFFVALMTAFPTSLPRFVAASLYIPMLIVFLPILKRGLCYFYFLIFSLLFLFPMLNSFRRYDSSQEFKLISASDLKFFIEGHFDSFQTFAQVVAHEIVTYGTQLLMAFFFWVPRSIWNDKPVSTGVEIGERLGAYFTNMSANIYAEGWINFGFLGAVFFALILGVSTSRIDSHFNLLFRFDIHVLRPKLRLHLLAYFIISPLFFITLRGDLVTGVANTLGISLAWYLVFCLTRTLERKVFIR